MNHSKYRLYIPNSDYFIREDSKEELEKFLNEESNKPGNEYLNESYIAKMIEINDGWKISFEYSSENLGRKKQVIDGITYLFLWRIKISYQRIKTLIKDTTWNPNK